MDFRLSFRPYRLPLRAVVRTAHGPWAARDGVIVRLEGAGGRVGFGEAAVLPWFGTETVGDTMAGCRELGESVDAARIAAVPVRLRCLRHALVEAARTPVGGLPSATALGVAALLPAGRSALGELAGKSEAGFRVFKWKVGIGAVADELALLDDVCAALPAGAKLRLDANGAWDRRQAERWLERCAERPVEFVEQPVAPGARGAADLLLGLAGDWPTPLALDESIASDGDVEQWLGAGWRGVFVVKPSLLGDVAAAMERLERAKADVVFSSALETAVGARSALRWAFAWKGARRALGFGVWPLFADSQFDGPAVAPFVRWEDVERLNPEAIWNALT